MLLLLRSHGPTVVVDSGAHVPDVLTISAHANDAMVLVPHVPD
jgi:hypothetical protein